MSWRVSPPTYFSNRAIRSQFRKDLDKRPGMWYNILKMPVLDAIEVAARQELFLKSYAEVGTIRKAAGIVHVGRNQVHQWREENVNGFRERFAAAHEDYIETLEAKMYDLIGEMRVGHNPTLLIFALKALRPAVYRDLSQVPADGARDVIRALEQWKLDHPSDSEKVPPKDEKCLLDL